MPQGVYRDCLPYRPSGCLGLKGIMGVLARDYTEIGDLQALNPIRVSGSGIVFMVRV